MAVINENIRFLRKSKGITQEELAKNIGITRSVVGAYEEGRAEPKLFTVQAFAKFFGVGVDELLNADLSKENPSSKTDTEGKNLRVLTIPVNDNNEELITLVPVQAAAGYLNGYADRDYIESLPRFSMPLKEISSNRTYRLFAIKGDSMLPVPSGSYIISEYLDNWKTIKDGSCYVLITQDEGVVYKRVLKKDNDTLLLRSDNTAYDPYEVNIDSVVEIWKANGYMSFTLPDPEKLSVPELSVMVKQLQEDLAKLKESKPN